MGEDLSYGARFAISIWVFTSVTLIILSINKITQSYNRSMQLSISSSVARSMRSDLLEISNYNKPLSGASYYSLVSRNIDSVAGITVVIDGVSHTDYEILLKYPAGLFTSTFDDNYFMTITKVGDL